MRKQIRIDSNPDASIFLLRMAGRKETEILNLGKPSDILSEDSVACLGFGEKEFKVFPCRQADMPSELPLFNPPEAAPNPTLHARYDEALTAYLNRLKEMAEKGEEGKIVAGRVLISPPEAHRAEVFNRLCRLYPSAFVFYLSTPQTGTWIGASPELLLRREGSLLHTMSLAGTRPAGTTGAWDMKNIREQAMVTDFICNTLRHHGLDPECGPTGTRIAGPVEHIVTEISCVLPDVFSLSNSSDLIKDLSPTPALSGLPRKIALEMLEKHEPFKRYLYGGCIGRIKNAEDWCFFVNLRSALLTSKGTCLYVGGGITAMSEPTKEWEETELKAVTLLKVFAPRSIRLPGEPPPPVKIGKPSRKSWKL